MVVTYFRIQSQYSLRGIEKAAKIEQNIRYSSQISNTESPGISRKSYLLQFSYMCTYYFRT
jgi:hypothetical protein